MLYEGKPVGTPDVSRFRIVHLPDLTLKAGEFYRIISQHKVHSFFTAPTAMRAIKKEDAEGNFRKEHGALCLLFLLSFSRHTFAVTIADTA